MSYALPSRFHAFQVVSDFDQFVSPDVRESTREEDAAMALDDWSGYYAPPAAPAAPSAASGPVAPAPVPTH